MRSYDFCLLFVVGCSASSGSVGLDSTSRIAELTQSQQGALCDWLATQYGGYGKTVNCANGAGSEVGPASQADCASGLAQASQSRTSCTATVGDFQDCTKWEIESACSSSPGSAPAACATVATAACSGSLDAGAD
jgi:hypothetical protein